MTAPYPADAWRHWQPTSAYQSRHSITCDRTGTWTAAPKDKESKP
jgi:hypothetical protein